MGEPGIDGCQLIALEVGFPFTCFGVAILRVMGTFSEIHRWRYYLVDRILVPLHNVFKGALLVGE